MLYLVTSAAAMTPSIGAGLVHSPPLRVTNHLMQQSVQPKRRKLPLKVARTDELSIVLFSVQLVAGKVATLTPPLGMFGMTQCCHCGW